VLNHVTARCMPGQTNEFSSEYLQTASHVLTYDADGGLEWRRVPLQSRGTCAGSTRSTKLGWNPTLCSGTSSAAMAAGLHSTAVNMRMLGRLRQALSEARLTLLLHTKALVCSSCTGSGMLCGRPACCHQEPRVPAHPRPSTWLTRSCAPGPSPMSTLPLSSPPQLPAALSTSTCGHGRSHWRQMAQASRSKQIAPDCKSEYRFWDLVPPRCRSVYNAVCSFAT
jgi:hypothetical protein